MAERAYTAGYLVMAVARDGICMYSAGMTTFVDRRPWELCWREEDRLRLRDAFVEACMFRRPQKAVPASFRLNERVFDFEAWLEPTGPEMVICRMIRVFSSVLSRREKDVLSLVAGGASNAEISELLGTREATVRSHLKKMRRKLGVSRPEGLLLAAVGLDEPSVGTN